MKPKHFVAVIVVIMIWSVGCFAQTVNISNGVVGAGHLDVNVDAFGSYGNFNPAYVDSFQPPGSAANSPSFTAGFSVFIGADKALLTSMPEWIAVLPPGSETLTKVVTSPVMNVNASTAMSSFNVNTAGGAPLLSVNVLNNANNPAAGIGVLDQVYMVTNASGGPLAFSLNRALDADLVWDADFLSDHVAVDSTLRFVAQHEPGSSTQAMALAAGSVGVPNSFYWGAKNTHLPTGGPPAMGFGTDIILWNNGGLPVSWQNYAAFVGYNMPGDSGLNSNDAHVGIDWSLNLAAGASVAVHVKTVYGAQWFCLLGDVNLDRMISLLDVSPFVNFLTSGLYRCEADINRDGMITLLDVAGFVNILSGG